MYPRLSLNHFLAKYCPRKRCPHAPDSCLCYLGPGGRVSKGKSKDRSNPLEDFDEAERLLERVEVELEGGHPLREGGKEC